MHFSTKVKRRFNPFGDRSKNHTVVIWYFKNFTEYKENGTGRKTNVSCPLYVLSEPTFSSLVIEGQRMKKTNYWHFLEKIFFFLWGSTTHMVTHLFSLFSTFHVFSPQVFPNGFLRTKRQTDFSLSSRHYIEKEDALIMMGVFLGFYQILSFTWNPLGSSVSYVNSLEKHHSNFVLLLKSQSRRRGSGSRRKSIVVRMARELNDKKRCWYLSSRSHTECCLYFCLVRDLHCK